MIALSALLTLLLTSSAETITTIIMKLIHPDDETDFLVGWESMWVPARKLWRAEMAMGLGGGCGFLFDGEEAVQANMGGGYEEAEADQRRDLALQKLLITEMVREYVYVLYEEGERPMWIVIDE